MEIYLPTESGQPQLQICAFKQQDHIDLQFDIADYQFRDEHNNVLFPDIQNNGFWRIKVKDSQLPEYAYYLILRESENRREMEELLSVYKQKQDNILLHEIGGTIFIDKHRVFSNQKYMVLAGPFSTEKEAHHSSKEFGQIVHSRIYRRLLKPAHGRIEIYDANYEQFIEVNNFIQVVPKNNKGYLRIKHFPIRHLHGQKTEHKDLFYRGRLKIIIDEHSSLSGINELAVEDYLKGVLLSEISPHAPEEFIRSMAIVARSYVFARLGQKHADEGFDFCSDSHCLRYYGKKIKAPQVDAAVRQTVGQVLQNHGRICNAYFSYSCGGHTENTSGVWLNEDVPYIQGKFDGEAVDDPGLDLTKEEDVRKWIMTRPEVNCKIDVQQWADSYELSADSFRWEVFYTRNELEEIMREKTGEDVGIIYEIIPLKRGVSGRIKEIEILGSLKNVHIAGEHNIRSALSETFLNSSCFIIKTELDNEGVPLNFVFIGAGKGHGVGLCKAGATKLATKGKDYKQILLHYFENCQIERIY